MQRTGRINMPSFRIIVTEHTESPKTGNVVERVGTYNPKTKERNLNGDRIKYWLSVGAQASDTMHNMLIGAGIIGSAIAFEMSKRSASKILVLDADLSGELSSTERNAGGVRHLWQQPVNIELARHSLNFFHEIADQIGFQKTGYLWLYSKENSAEATATITHAKRFGLEYELLSVTDIRNRYPIIDKTDDLSHAVFGPRDGLINSNAQKLF